MSSSKENFKINNKIAITLIGVIAVALGLLGISVLISEAIYTPERYPHLVNMLTLFTQFFGLAIGVIVAYTAMANLNVWNKQLRYGKYLNIIWNANTSLRAVKQDLLTWFSYNKIYLNENFQYANEDEERRFNQFVSDMESSLKTLIKHFDELDVIVEDSTLNWAGMASDLRVEIADISVLQRQFSNQTGEATTLEDFKKIDILFKSMDAVIGSLTKELVILESKII